MRHPLIMRHGVVQAALDERVTIWKLNIGPSEPIITTGSIISVTSTLHHFISLVGKQDVDTILGGVEGDLLVLTGEDVRLTNGGGNININKNLDLEADTARAFIYIAGMWTPVKL